MAQTSVNIKSVKSGKVINKAITFVNGEAKNEDLAQMGTMMNALTSNTYVETNRVDKSNCDTEDQPSAPVTLTVGEYRTYGAETYLAPGNFSVQSTTIEGGVRINFIHTPLDPTEGDEQTIGYVDVTY